PFQRGAVKHGAVGMQGLFQVRALGRRGSCHLHASESGPLVQRNMKDRVGELMCFVELRFGLQPCLEESLRSQELEQTVFRLRDATFLIPLLVGEINGLKQSRVLESLRRTWEADQTNVENGLYRKRHA